MLNRQKFEKWQRWMKAVASDLTHTVNNQAIFQHLNLNVMRRNRDHLRKISAGTFLDFVRGCYVDAAITAVRRHVKPQKDSISLMGVLLEIADEASNLTFDFYKTVHSNPYSWMDWRWATFQSFSCGRNTVSRKLVLRHVRKVESLGGKVEDVADRRVCHLDKRGVKKPLLYGELKGAISDLNHVACKYCALINGDGFSTLRPTIDDSWTDVFRSPLIPES